ncbi:MAG: ATP-binding protein [Thermoanaerobaculia bacterium]|nr:ATP-binding protein [Thermoanaerobaculia bacterium]
MRWAFVLGWSAVFAPYLGLLAGRAPSAAYRNAWAFVALAGLVVAACLIDLPRQARREERRFRLLVAAAFAVWAASELFEHLLAGLSAAARRGVGDVAFVVFGVLMSAAALVTSERGLSRSEVGLRRLHRAEVALFAGGVFVYLIVLPPRFDPALAASSVPSALLYLTLDLLMLGLFLWRRSRAPAAGVRWTALAVAAALFLLSDALFLAVLGGRFDLERHALADLFWYLPHLAVIVAVRGTGRAASVGDGAPSAAGRVQLRIAPGFLYAALVPVVHLVAESASAATAAGGQAQRHFALALTLGLLLLAWAHQRRQRAVWDELRRELAAGARRRAAAAKLEAIGRLAAGVAHDFNNLLTVVVGRAELAQARLAAAGERRELDAILELSQRATALTSELLAVGEREPRVREAIAVDAFVESRRSRFEERAGGRVAVVLELDAAGGRIEVDPGHLDRMLDNLVANALDAMPSGGRLTLATRRQRLVAGWTRHLDEIAAGDYVTLEVRDEGVGMDAELLTRVFEPFFTTKDLGRSAGLGLATVRGLVRQNGGQVVAHSRPGAGTSFEIYFPETA